METFAETLTARETSVAAAGAIAGSMITVVLVAALVLWVLTIIASWKILQKAGEPGWKAVIPIYNVYMLYKIVGMSGWFWSSLICGVVLSIVMVIDGTSGIFNMNSAQLEVYDWGKHIPTVICLFACAIFELVIQIIYSMRTSKAFGHGGGFALGLFFFTPIFWLILGFGSSKYHKKVALKK